MTADQIVKQILDAFASCGHLDYGEHISMQEHMLQAACFAEKNGEDDRVIVSALLHDYGHLVCNMPNNVFSEGNDNYHEDIGAQALEGWFDEDMIGAVKLHVDAKRYLCAATPKYKEQLSAASIMTLAVQGGPMNQQEMKRFEQQKGHRLALKVRVFDDQGKYPEMERPDLSHYIEKIKACLL